MKSNQNTLPPRVAQRFLFWFLKNDLAEEVAGDLEEQFFTQLEKAGPRRARRDYWYQVFNYLRPFAIRSFSHLKPFFMFRHNLKISYRTLARDRGYSFLNIGGLALGMTTALLIGNHSGQLPIDGMMVATAVAIQSGSTRKPAVFHIFEYHVFGNRGSHISFVFKITDKERFNGRQTRNNFMNDSSPKALPNSSIVLYTYLTERYMVRGCRVGYTGFKYTQGQRAIHTTLID